MLPKKKMNALGLLMIITIILLSILFIVGCVEKPANSNNNTITYTIPEPVGNDAIKEKIKNNLIGTFIVYHDIAGRPITFNVTDENIKNIETTTLDGKTVWKVRIGEGLAWDYYYDEQGNEVIKKEQLFRTSGKINEA